MGKGKNKGGDLFTKMVNAGKKSTGKYYDSGKKRMSKAIKR